MSTSWPSRALRRVKNITRPAATFVAALLLLVPLTAQARQIVPAQAQGSPLLHLAPSWGTGDHVDLVYVANATTNTITVYLSSAAGNTPPLFTIGGPNTRLAHPVGLTFDDDGQLYVANAGNASVTIYPWFAWGNIAPIRTIAGPHTHLEADANNYLSGPIAVDTRYGRLFVGRVSTEQAPLAGNVLVFSAAAAGDAAPLTSIGAGNSQVFPGFPPAPNVAVAVAIDRHGYLLVANEGDYCCHGSDGWTYYNRSDLVSLSEGFAYYANDGIAGVAIDPVTDYIVAAYEPPSGDLDVWPPMVRTAVGSAPGQQRPVLLFHADGPLAIADSTVWCLASPSQVDRFTRASSNPAAVLRGSRTLLDGAVGIAVRQIAF